MLLGPNGQPISSTQFKKAKPPKLGEAFGDWAGRDIQFMQLPGGGVVQFDLSKLNLMDYRNMRDHYQVNASLAVLSFMQHQSDWHIECEDQKIADFCESALREIWTPLNRALSTANWAGFSPNVMDWENDLNKRSVIVGKWKDLLPEECTVNWKLVEGWAPPDRSKPKFKVYDGIKQLGQPYVIPSENSFWYPLLMENGDYYGRKLLRPAFQSWFFSILIHLFANRYYERFGEPTPIGRAPFDEDIETPNGTQRGADFLLNILMQLRNRGAVVLPNDRTYDTNNGRPSFDYEIEYLESQMRGADFERYLTRLDEEISIGLFTPILLLRTADVGSYNLGVGHMQMYLWMLNAMNDDRAQYINKYILRRITNYNFSEKAPSPKIVFRKLGNSNAELLRALLTELVRQGKVELDLRELGQMTGMTITEVEQTIAPPTDSGDDADADTGATGPGGEDAGSPRVAQETRATALEIFKRVKPQVERAWSAGNFGPDLNLSMGYKRKFEKALAADGFAFPVNVSNEFYDRLDRWVQDVLPLGMEEFSSPDSFLSLFKRVLDNEVNALLETR